MSGVLTEKSDVECGHSGIVSVVGVSTLTVNQGKVLLEAGVALMDVSKDCLNPKGPLPAVQCKKVLSILPISKASKLKVNGAPVILETLKGLTNGNPFGVLLAKAKQDKLTAT